MKKNLMWLGALLPALLVACGGNTPDATGQFALSTQSSVSFVDAPRSTTRSNRAATAYDTAVQQLYIAYFGRPADPTGLTNFAAALAAANAPTSIQGLSAAYAGDPAIRGLVNAFGTSDESNSLYSGDTASFVNAIYQNVLNRSADAGGLNFWVGAIDSGNLTKGNAALSIMAGALTNTTPQGLIDRDTVNNKVTVGTGFTALLTSANQTGAYSGDGAAAVARTMLANVSSSTDVNGYQATVNNTVTALAASAGTAPAASPFAGTYTVTDGEVTISFVVGSDGKISSCFSTTSVVCSGSVSSNGALNLSGNDGETPIDTSATLTGTITASGTVAGTYTGTSTSEGAFSGSFQGSRISSRIPVNVMPAVQDGEASGDAAADNSTNARIELGVPISGATGKLAGDQDDRFAIDLTAGVDYTFDLSGTLHETSEYTQTWQVLSLYSSAGRSVTMTDGFGTRDTTDARLYFRPSTTGTYYLHVRHAGLTYTLSATGSPIIRDVPSDAWNLSMWHQVGNSQVYNLGTTNTNFNIMVYLPAGKTYTFTPTTGRRQWNFTLVDFDGNVVASGQTLTFTATKEGLYRISGSGNGTFAIGSSATSVAKDGLGSGPNDGTTTEPPKTASCKAANSPLGSGPVVMMSTKADAPVACYKNRLDTFGWTGFDDTVEDACRGAQDPKKNGDLTFYKAKNLSACYCIKNGKVNTMTQGFVCWVFFDSGSGPN
ncbi:MAG TPA: DUF4214 domain-containing protein [Noviherbaspirillum sp.]|nr:DUF4214 domain-containing protein [Noviherbaspirillum sp.]